MSLSSLPLLALGPLTCTSSASDEITRGATDPVRDALFIEGRGPKEYDNAQAGSSTRQSAPLLRLGFGLTAIVAGADKFFNVLTDWTMYLSPVAEALSPVSAQGSMHIAGIVEVLVGVALLTPLVQPASYVLAGWLGAIALNLLLTGHYFDIAARDVLLALAAYTLASLTVASRKTPEAG